jgi:AcrR family transcriptional regulator
MPVTDAPGTPDGTSEGVSDAQLEPSANTVEATERSPRDRLLDAVIAYGGIHGLAETSLRALAKGVGTSHRMLLHHFGSRDELLVAVVHEVERRQLTAFVDLADADQPSIARAALDRIAIGRVFWDRLSDPALAPLERLFFELYSQALLGATWGPEFLDGIVDSWVDPVADLLEAEGVERGTARARARLGVAVSRGLLLDLLATGDHAGVDAAMDEFLALTA